MKKVMVFLMVWCLAVLSTGCYTTIGISKTQQSDNVPAEIEETETIAGGGEEVVGSSEIPLDKYQSLFDDRKVVGEYQDGVLVLDSRDKKSGVIYTFDVSEAAQAAKVYFTSKGEGVLFVLITKGTPGEEKTSCALSGERPIKRELPLYPLENYLQNDEKGNKVVELCVETEEGKPLEISAIKIDFLATKPKVRTVVHYKEQPPIAEEYRYCHPGVVYVYNPLGYYDVYYDWWTGSRYLVWRGYYYDTIVCRWPVERVYYCHHHHHDGHYAPAPRVQYRERDYDPNFVMHHKPSASVQKREGEQRGVRTATKNRFNRETANVTRNRPSAGSGGEQNQKMLLRRSDSAPASVKRSERGIESTPSKPAEAPRESFFNSMKKRIFSGETGNSAPAVRRAEPRREQAPQQQTQPQNRREQGQVLRAEPRQAPAPSNPSSSVSDDEDEKDKQNATGSTGGSSSAKARTGPRSR